MIEPCDALCADAVHARVVAAGSEGSEFDEVGEASGAAEL